jgi:hypothetical protein
VPYGSGVGNVKGMLAETHRQKLKTTFILEYEFNSGKLMNDLAQSVNYFDTIASELAAKG